MHLFYCIAGKGCGGIFYNYLGKFTSPLYPAAYRERKTCTWEIIVPQGMQVMLKFSGRIKISVVLLINFYQTPLSF